MAQRPSPVRPMGADYVVNGPPLSLLIGPQSDGRHPTKNEMVPEISFFAPKDTIKNNSLKA